MKKIVVTGSSGKAGTFVFNHLKNVGFDVFGVDLNAPAESSPTGTVSFVKADINNLSETIEVLNNAEVVVHLANIPIPGMYAPSRTFITNTEMNYNVFSASITAGISKVIWISSDVVMGLPYDRPPKFFPLTEDHPSVPENTYGLSKVISEIMAQNFSRWTDLTFIGLRSTFIQQDSDYKYYYKFQNDIHARKWHLWSYIDIRDVARACELAINSDISGCNIVNIAASDSVMDIPSPVLIKEVFPDVPVTKNLKGYDSLISCDKARKIIDFYPKYSWRDYKNRIKKTDDTHIVCFMPRDIFTTAMQSGIYSAASLQEEGYIHACQPHQLVEVANKFYSQHQDLFAIYINRNLVNSEVLDEEAADPELRYKGETYPHIYGSLNMDAVDLTVELKRDEDGSFIEPADSIKDIAFDN